MDQDAIMAEIAAQSKLVDSIAINKEMVTQIDRNFKEKEEQLNQRLVHVRTSFIGRHFLPPMSQALLATNIDDEKVWNSIQFMKLFPRKRNTYEELSFERATKGFGFFYLGGEVEYELGFVQEHGGADFYVRVIEDKREFVKVTGASVEIKIRAFLLLSELLQEIDKRASNVANSLEDYAKRYVQNRMR